MRQLGGWLGQLVKAYGVLASLLAIHTTWFGALEPRLLRPLHVLLLLPLIFLLYPATRRSPRDRPTWADWAWVAAVLAAAGYLVLNHRELNLRYDGVSPVTLAEIVLGTVMIVAALEAARRAVSPWLPVTTLVAIAYLFVAPYLPGVLHYKPVPYARVVEMMFLRGSEGIFGFLMGISATILAIFILFAVFLLESGVGQFLMELASSLAGRFRGGPAKVAVLSSALYGMVSGSSSADVYATGSFTIPLMKRTGYSPRMAAAIEAVASAGGPLMPPVMGAGAFIMAEMTGIPYSKIVVAAILPALLYYVGVMAVVHLEALRLGLQPVPADELPSVAGLLRRSYRLVPFAGVIYFLLAGYSPAKAALYGLLLSVLVSLPDPATRLGPRRLADTLFRGAVSMAGIATALACSGMIVAALTQTGLALAFSSLVMGLSRGNVVLALLMVFLLVSVLGTGIPTTAAYVIAVTVAAGTLTGLGVPLLAAHLFVFYYAVLADVTPPDAVTAFAAAQIAGADPIRTGLTAPVIAAAGFLVPFVFALEPALILEGPWPATLWVTASAVAGIVGLAFAVVGHYRGPLSLLWRVLFALVAVVAISPRFVPSLVGMLALAGLIGLRAWRVRPGGAWAGARPPVRGALDAGRTEAAALESAREVE